MVPGDGLGRALHRNAAPAGSQVSSSSSSSKRGASRYTRQQQRQRPQVQAAAEPVMQPTESLTERLPPAGSPDQQGGYVPPTRANLPSQKYGVSVWEAMGFFGLGPEIINGRLAMVGFIAGAMRENSTGQPILQQAQSHPWQVAAVVGLVTVSSLIPITKGVRFEPFGPFTPAAEQVNGRAAQLGFAAVLYLEHKLGLPFF